MDYKHDIIIKHEKEDISEDKNCNYLEASCDVEIKVEHAEIFNDWCIQNALSSTEQFRKIISYKELKKQCFQTCIICREFFVDSYSLLRHNLIHLKVPLIQRRVFICDDCPNYYKKKTDLQDHITSVHQGQSHLSILKRTHKCQLCKKTYTYSSWYSHMKYVHGQLSLNCNQCHLKFKCERYLKKHIMYTHDGLKPLWRCRGLIENVKCPKCPTILNSKYALTTHLRNCHSDKRYMCKICKSTLKCRSYLLTHMQRVHYDDGQNHQCDICGKGFKSPRYVKIHVKNSHYNNS